MKIDETIERLKSEAIKDSYNMQGYSKKQKEQIAEWLEELKNLRELNLALADKVLNSEFGYCFTCDNHMKNITIDGVNNGCDGSCRHNKEYSVEEFLEMFKKRYELEKRLRNGSDDK